MSPIPSHAIHFNLVHVCPSFPHIIFAVLPIPSFLDMSSDLCVSLSLLVVTQPLYHRALVTCGGMTNVCCPAIE